MDENENKITVEAKTNYTLSDFMETTAPYEEVYKYYNNTFLHQIELERMTSIARDVKYPSFKQTYKEYVRSITQSSMNVSLSGNVTDFSNAPLQLNSGTWVCDDDGIMGSDGFEANKFACHHPLLPIECWENIDTGEEKLKIAYRKRNVWRELVVSKDILLNTNKITVLASRGIDVSSESAKMLVNYIQEIEQLNINNIPLKKSVSKLGYITGGFSPYVDNVMFDGENEYEKIYKSVKEPSGTLEEWLSIAKECRKMSLTARMMLAASFASVLVKPIGALPFFVHLWGGSGTGKSVALMLAASVWANPEFGTYVQTFDSTSVGHERTIAFLNNLPYCIDELQLAKDRRGNTVFNVYKLAQGVGRTRGKKTGGIEQTPTWSNCILTTGESPLTNLSSGAGAVNRVIDIECTDKDKVITDGQRISYALRSHYGHAGREFIKLIEDEQVLENVKEMYKYNFSELSKRDTTEKQAAAAAIILTADSLITDLLFKDGKGIQFDEICEFLQTTANVSSGLRGYNYMCDWVSINSNKFTNENKVDQTSEFNTNDVYGIIQDGYAYIINSKFVSVLEQEGYSYSMIRSYLRDNKLILTRGKRYTRGKRINGILTECVVMLLPSDDNSSDLNNEQMLQSDEQIL